MTLVLLLEKALFWRVLKPQNRGRQTGSSQQLTGDIWRTCSACGHDQLDTTCAAPGRGLMAKQSWFMGYVD